MKLVNFIFFSKSKCVHVNKIYLNIKDQNLEKNTLIL